MKEGRVYRAVYKQQKRGAETATKVRKNRHVWDPLKAMREAAKRKRKESISE